MTKSRDQITEEELALIARRQQRIIRDVVGLTGFAVFEFGLWLVYGTGVACIIGGAVLCGLTVLGILRRPAS